MNVLSVKNLNKKFKDFSLKDISFELPKGYIMGYVGQNGAGKTTTLQLITHLLKADSGEVRINGISYKDDPIKYKEMIGYIGDESYFLIEFNLLQIGKIMEDFYPTFNKQRYTELVERFKLPEKKRVKDYSKGMKIRLMFATILARDTKLLILDEATNGLDPVIKDEILELLQGYIEDGEKSVLFSTHILSDLEHISDYLFFIDEGEKVLFDSKDELLEKYVLVKGGKEDLTPKIKSKIIGLKQNEVGFEGLLESDSAEYLGNGFLVEKPHIEQIVIHFIREKGAEK